MHAQSAAAAFGEDGEIAASLGGLYGAESIFLVRNRKVDGVVAGDLQKHATVGSTFVGLTGGVQKAGAEAEDGGDFLLVAYGETNGLQSFFVGFVHGDVAEESEIISGMEAAEMSFQDFHEARAAFEGVGIFFVGVELDAVAFEKRRFVGQLAGFFVLAGQFFGFNFAGFDVGLIEGVDADDRACDGGGNFPAEEFLAEVVDIVDGDAYDGMAGGFKSADGGILGFVGGGFEAQIGEDAIVAVGVEFRERFAIDGDDAFADLAGGLGD